MYFEEIQTIWKISSEGHIKFSPSIAAQALSIWYPPATLFRGYCVCLLDRHQWSLYWTGGNGKIQEFSLTNPQPIKQLYCVFNMFFPHRSASTLSFMYTIFVHKILITEKFNGLLDRLLLYSCLKLLHCHSGCCYLKCCFWLEWHLWYL